MQNDRGLAIPHISVKDISEIDWRALRSAGVKACVFDKDNTLCKPFALTVDPALLPSLEECLEAFDGKVALFSNSAGLEQYDPYGAHVCACTDRQQQHLAGVISALPGFEGC
jgi:phosphatidylglycerophosphatase GEP4